MLLIVGGGLMAIYFGLLTFHGIMRGIEYGDLSYNFPERLSPALLLVAGILELLSGIGGLKPKSGKKRTAPLIVAVVVTLIIGAFVFYVNSLSMMVLLVLLVGLVTQVMYLVSAKRS